MVGSRAIDDERGVTAVLMTLVILILFGFTALAVDAARAYQERRQLQTAADSAAISGAQVLLDSEASAEAVGQFYVTSNPSVHHPGAYDTITGDLVDAKLVANGTGCPIDGVTYDCVQAKVVAPPKSDDPDGFEWLFASALGFDETWIEANATAVLGAGAPGGEKLVPWIVMDCPTQTHEGVDYDEALAKVNSVQPGRCPYEYTTDGWNGSRVNLFLDTPNAEGGNFQGGDLAVEPCNSPSTPDGLFPKGGGANDYSNLLAGLDTPDTVPCNVGRGARVYPKTGVMVGPTNQGLNARGVDDDTCANETAFNSAVEETNVNGIYRILDQTNPCLVSLILAVHVNLSYPGVETDIPGGCCVTAMQHPDAFDADDDGDWRFASPDGGTSKPLVTRRFASFYITETGNSQRPYRGIFLRAMDSANARLDRRPCDALDGVCVVKLTG